MGPGRQGRPDPHARHRRGGARPRSRLATPQTATEDRRPRRQRAGSPAQEEPMNREQKAAAIDEIASQITRVGGDLRGRLPRHLRAPGRRAAREAARRRRHVPGRQELAHRARRRPGRRRDAEGAARGADRADVRARRRRARREGARRLTPRAGRSCSRSRAG